MPGSPGHVSFKEWLWALSGWQRLTGICHAERGIALGMSLGGKAGRTAKSIPHDMLGQQWGLAYLISRLEREFGSELQDRVRNHVRLFLRYRRQKGSSALRAPALRG